MVNKSNTYTFVRVTRELDRLCDELGFGFQLSKEEMFEALVHMGYLKSLHQLTCPQIAQQNME